MNYIREAITQQHIGEEAIALRRHLHAHPDLSEQEFPTMELVCEHLDAAGIPYKRNVAESGVVGLIKGAFPGPVIALRADMDALPIQEDHPDAPYCSKTAGVMHACGHDAHAAMGLAVAHWIHDNAKELRGTIKLIFQPAEEGTKGAAGIAYSKNLDDVDYLVGGHIGVDAKLHEVAVIRNGFLATTKMNVTFTGVPAHAGAAAELGRNALMAACSAAMQIMGIARHGKGDTSVNIGTISAGEGRNVVPVHAKMELEVRGKNDEINRYMQETAERMIRGSAESYGVKYKIDVMGMATDIHSDSALSDMLEEEAKKVPTVKKVFDINSCTGSEDCSLLMKTVQKHGGQATFFYYGCNHHGHHRGDFEIQDTESMPEGFEIFVRMLERLNSDSAQ